MIDAQREAESITVQFRNAEIFFACITLLIRVRIVGLGLFIEKKTKENRRKTTIRTHAYYLYVYDSP